jgi:protein-S-isoprenylcysteine O-methyltransferase Ste14
MTTQNSELGPIIAGLVVVCLGLIHVVYPKQVARFMTNHYRGKELIEELFPNQHIRPSFARALGLVLIGIGIWLCLAGLKII